jgi:anti-sigma B factor antagonist
LFSRFIEAKETVYVIYFCKIVQDNLLKHNFFVQEQKFTQNPKTITTLGRRWAMKKFKILYLKEDITLKNVEYLQRTITKLINGNNEYIILNMEKVRYINSIGLEIIAKCAIIAKERKKEIVITNIGSPLKEIFQTIKLPIFTKLFDSDQEAIDYFNKKDDTLEVK